VTEIVNGSLSYTTLSESLAYMGKPGEKGTLHEIFDTVMDLNLANGAADTKLVAADQIDNSAINKVPVK
jgi:NitT/TauT family transport system substrate-binding protein